MIDPKTLSVEERAIVEETVTANVSFDGLACDLFWDKCYEFAIQRILARRALFGEPASEGAKVETTADRIAADLAAGTFRGAQPKPAAPVGNEDCLKAKAEGPWLAEVLKPAAPVGEMPEAVRRAIQCLRETNAGIVHYLGVDGKVADALETFWRTHAAQPKVAMTEELERVLSTLHILAGEMGTNVGNGVRADIAAVRAQASQPQRGR